MSEARLARLVDNLAADLKPVRRVPRPLVSAAMWLAVVIALAIVLAAFADLKAMSHRLMATPDMWLAVLGSTLTAVLAAIAAFEIDLPDRSPWWALLPLPAFALWVGASGMGCARGWLVPGTQTVSMDETMHCLRFIVALSVPLSGLIFLMLRRGYSLYPSLTGGLAGLAVASAAATLLNFFHPFDAAVSDLAVHAAAVGLVALVNNWIGGRLLGRRRFSR